MNTIKNMKSKLALTLLTMASVTAVNVQANGGVLPGFENCGGPITKTVAKEAEKVVESVWPVIGDNLVAIGGHFVTATKLVWSYVPGFLKQLTHEAQVITDAGKACPIISAAVLGYAAYKAYNWYYADDHNGQNRR